MPKEFHLGDILSVVEASAPRVLVSPNGMQGIYDILQYMTSDDNIFTHQLGRVADECEPYLRMEMPWLSEIDSSSVTPENWKSWLDKQVQKYGEKHQVYPILSEDHTKIDPLEELISKIQS